MRVCPICGKEFEAYTRMRKDAKGEYWCKECQDDFDSIDWEERLERRLDEGEL